MKALIGLTAIFLSVLAASCCSKKGACPDVDFDTLVLNNFDSAEVSDSVYWLRYDPKSNFTSCIDSQMCKTEKGDIARSYRIKLSSMKTDVDYALKVNKTRGVYRISNFSGEKIACGKCFLRSNNQFGYQLSGYSVNNRFFAYKGEIAIPR